jgi:hypothetical protein
MPLLPPRQHPLNSSRRPRPRAATSCNPGPACASWPCPLKPRCWASGSAASPGSSASPEPRPRVRRRRRRAAAGCSAGAPGREGKGGREWERNDGRAGQGPSKGGVSSLWVPRLCARQDLQGIENSDNSLSLTHTHTHTHTCRPPARSRLKALRATLPGSVSTHSTSPCLSLI